MTNAPHEPFRKAAELEPSQLSLIDHLILLTLDVIGGGSPADVYAETGIPKPVIATELCLLRAFNRLQLRDGRLAARRSTAFFCPPVEELMPQRLISRIRRESARPRAL